MSLIIGLLASPILLYLPGAIWSRGFCAPADRLDRHYDRLVASALWSGWLAFVLAELGIFSLPLHVAGTLAFCGLGWFRGRKGGGEPLSGEFRPRWETPLYVAILAIFALLVARPFETMLGGRDAGVYANAGYAIVRTGGIALDEPLIAQIARDRQSDDPAVREPAAQAYTNLLGRQDPERFMATRFTQPSFFTTEDGALAGRIIPGGFHLYPAWLALWTALFGLHGGLAATGFLAWLGTWSVAMAGRRLVKGAAGAYLATATLVFLAFNALQIWFGRYTTAESGTQMLLWAGLAMWARFADLGPAERGGAVGRWYGGLAGLAIGQLVLIRLEFFWGVGPLLAYLVATAVRRRWTRGETSMGLGLGAMLIHGLAHIATLSRTYFLDNTWGKFQDYALISRLAHPFYSDVLQSIRLNNSKTPILTSVPRLLAELLAVAAIAGGLYALWRWPRLAEAIERRALRSRAIVLGGFAIGLIVIAAYAYFVRPQRLTLDALIHPIDNRAQWESYIGAPLPVPPAPKGQAQRMVVLGNMVRLGWYLSPLGIALGVAGLAGWIWRDFNRRSWLILTTGIAYAAFYINDTYGTADQVYIYIARRFIPGALPIFALGAGWLVAMLAGSRQLAWRVAGLLCAGALAAFLVATGWRGALHTEYRGAIDAIAKLADKLEPNAIVIMKGGDRDTPTNIATPLRYAFNREAFVAYPQDPSPYRAQLAAQVRRWQQQGRPVYLLLGSNGGILSLPGFRLDDRGLFDLQLAEWQQLQIQKPFAAGTIRFTYRLYALEPEAHTPATDAGAPIAVSFGPTSYAWQASGLYPVEYQTAADGATMGYAWTNGDARLILPALAQTSTLRLDLGLGSLPPSLQQKPVDICPVLTPLSADPAAAPARPLPCVAIRSADPATTTWTLPPLGGATWVLSLPTRVWSPDAYKAEYPTPPNDSRTLGIQWGGGSISVP